MERDRVQVEAGYSRREEFMSIVGEELMLSQSVAGRELMLSVAEEELVSSFAGEEWMLSVAGGELMLSVAGEELVLLFLAVE
jgi:hypothetical protein